MSLLKLWKIAFGLIVFIHILFICVNTASVFFLLVHEPWYVSIPLISFIANISVNNWKCPLTMVENYIRVKLGMPKISGFIGHYFIRFSR